MDERAELISKLMEFSREKYGMLSEKQEKQIIELADMWLFLLDDTEE